MGNFRQSEKRESFKRSSRPEGRGFGRTARPDSRGSDRPERRSEGRFERRAPETRFSRQDDRTLTFYDAVCAKCGNECKVPFKPSGSKPVLCRDCFKKGDSDYSSPSPAPRRESPISSEQLDTINLKLDKIMKAMNLK